MRIFFYVARPGFEPRQTEPKSVVLPLYYRASSLAGRKNKIFTFLRQNFNHQSWMNFNQSILTR